MSLISVIIPTYNRVECLRQVIPSYLNQSSVREIIIVDNHSTDGTPAYLTKLRKKHRNIRIITNKENIGLPGSRAVAIKASRAPYIFFGENDLALGEKHLSILLKHLKNTKADIIAGRRVWLEPGESYEAALRKRNTFRGRPVDMRLLTTNCELKLDDDTKLPVIEGSMLIRKSVFKRVQFDMHYRRNAFREETDFQIQAGMSGYSLVSCPHTATFHLHKDNDSGGNHTASRVTYEKNVLMNDYYFVNKYRKYLNSLDGFPGVWPHLFFFTLHRLFSKYLQQEFTARLTKIKRHFLD